jgi:hypothetical protein
VRQLSIADIALSWPKLTWPALARRHAGPWSRKISATSSAGRDTRAALLGGWLGLLELARDVIERAHDLADRLGSHASVEGTNGNKMGVGLRVLVCGGRNYDDYPGLAAWLDRFHAERGPVAVLIHGGAKGADSLAERWAMARGISIARYDADWERHGRAAGPIRNKQMLDEGKPDIVVAYPGGRGTANMISQARSRGVAVIEVST